MKFKHVKLEVKDVSDAGEFSGYAAVFNNEDLGGDIIMPGAFTKTITENPSVPVLWGHSPREVIGVNASWSEDAKGLNVKGQLVMDVQRAKEARSLMQAKAVKGMSIGYDPIVIDWTREKEGIRILREVKVWEYSLTPFPMNPEATVTGCKSGEEFAETLHEILVALKRAPARISADQKSLVEQIVQEFSALQAAEAPGAATQYDVAPESLHAMEGIQSILRG